MRARVRREAGCYVGEIRLRNGIVIGAAADDAVSAIERAAALADRLASDPIVKAILPPQAVAALAAMRAAASAVKSGDLETLVRKVGPQVAKRAVSLLRKVF